MSDIGKHKGWLLVYEIQLWIFLLGTVAIFWFSAPDLTSQLWILAVFWAIPILSLYRPSSAVRTGHIIFNWLLVASSVFQLYSNLPSDADPSMRAGEYAGSLLIIALFTAWAIYWQKSNRVQNSYLGRRTVVVVKCNECGAEIASTAKFCTNCGAPIHTSGPGKAINLESEMPEPRKSLFIWIVIVGIGLVGTIASILIPAFAGQKPGTDSPVALYVMFWTGLFFYLMWKQQGKKSWQGTLIGLGVGFFVYTGAIMVANSNRSLENDKAGLEQVVDMMEEFIEESNKLNPDGTPARIDKTFTPSSDATGSMAILQQFIADIVNQAAAMNNEYLSELDSLGWNNLLEKDWLDSDPTMKKSWHMITEAQALVDIAERRAMEVMSNARNNIQYLELSDAEKKEFLDGFDRGLKQSAASTSRVWELEKLTIDETESIISLLAEDRNSWNIEDGQFFFETDEQIDRFNKHLANIEKFYAEQMEMQDRVIERQRKAIDEL